MNVLAFRLIRDISVVWPRSACPACGTMIAWHDNIPVVSWIILRGKCRHCTSTISWLYPFIELFTAAVMTALYVKLVGYDANFTDFQGLADLPALPTFFPAFFMLFSALIVTIRSDIETMLITRFVTLFLIPFGLLFSAFGFLPITLTESIAGSLLGYFFLYTAARLFFRYTGKEGIGQGDLELLAFIGAFTGILGCWIALLLGSIIGSVIGIGCIIANNMHRDIKIPFGPFLALGAIAFVLLREEIVRLILLP